MYSRINYVQPRRGNFLRECPGIIKMMHTGFMRTRIALCQRPVLTQKIGRYDLAWKDLVEGVLNAQ